MSYSSSLTEAGVGAGTDSYYEYVLKAYVLLGDEKYLYRFDKVRMRRLSLHNFLSHISVKKIWFKEGQGFDLKNCFR